MVPWSWRNWASCCVIICLVSSPWCRGANIIASPGEAGLRAAIASAQNGDTVTITSRVELTSPLRIDKQITLRSNGGDPWDVYLQGAFDGELLQLATNGIVVELLRLFGSFQTDGLRLEADVRLRDCVIQAMRNPVVIDWEVFPHTRLELQGVTVIECQQGLECTMLEAKDCTFTLMKDFVAVSAGQAYVERCAFERNTGDGFLLGYGSIKDCTFRFNGGLGLRFDPDPGLINLNGSLFYANAGGGALLGEQAIATVDNCTFTRHTGSPAIVVDQADGVLLRHCTVTDNLLLDAGPGAAGGAVSIRSGPVELQNCLVAENPTSDDPNASGMSGTWTDGGGNVIGGTAGLDILRDNGGPTLTMLPLPGSPALNSGKPSALIVDARGLSRAAGAGPDAGAAEANAAPLVDSDQDGMPDIWEKFYALNPASAADASSDTDADSRTALAEFRSGTDPNNAQSLMQIEEFRLDPDLIDPNRRIVVFKWRPTPGITYRVEISTDLQQWQTALGYTNLETIQPDIRALQFTGVAESAMSFYRLTVVD